MEALYTLNSPPVVSFNFGSPKTLNPQTLCIPKITTFQLQGTLSPGGGSDEGGDALRLRVEERREPPARGPGQFLRVLWFRGSGFWVLGLGFRGLRGSGLTVGNRGFHNYLYYFGGTP